MLAIWCGVIVWRRAGNAVHEIASAIPEMATASEEVATVWPWCAWPLAMVRSAACGSVLLLAVTNKICQDIAVVPFLWVLPLSLYLLSFIVVSTVRGGRRRFWLPWLALALGTVFCVMLGENVTVPDTTWLRPVRWL